MLSVKMVEPISASNGIQKVQICDPDSNKCAKVGGFYSNWWNDVRDPGLKFAGVLMFAVS